MANFHFDADLTIVGSVFTHAGGEEFALSTLDRMNHILVIGKTSMGKTRLLIDPRGDLQDDLPSG